MHGKAVVCMDTADLSIHFTPAPPSAQQIPRYRDQNALATNPMILQHTDGQKKALDKQFRLIHVSADFTEQSGVGIKGT